MCGVQLCVYSVYIYVCSVCLMFISFIAIAMNSRDQYKIIGLNEILHFIKQPCNRDYLKKSIRNALNLLKQPVPWLNKAEN